ncbi:MAG: thioesterase family protein [Acidobacteriota bacterium]|jgi:acyl-CoA thioester hydrolase
MSGYPVEVEIPVRFRDVDGMGHVNNAVFHTYLESARLVYWQTVFEDRGLGASLDEIAFILARMECDFRGQIPFGDAVRVRIRCPRIGGKSFDFDYRIESPDGRTLYAEARSVQVCFDYDRNETVAVTDDLRRRIARLEGWEAP